MPRSPCPSPSRSPTPATQDPNCAPAWFARSVSESVHADADEGTSSASATIAASVIHGLEPAPRGPDLAGRPSTAHLELHRSEPRLACAIVEVLDDDAVRGASLQELREVESAVVTEQDVASVRHDARRVRGVDHEHARAV